MKLFYTRQELIAQWLECHQADACSDDLTTNALAGYVETACGFIWFAYYKNGGLK